MDANEKIQLDDITFDDVIGGDGVAIEEIAPVQEDEKKVETPENDLLENKEEIVKEEKEEEKEEEEEEKVPVSKEEDNEKDEKEDDKEVQDKNEEVDDSIVGSVLDKLGYEVDVNYDDTTEGLVELTKDMASQIADERMEEVLDKFPLVKQHLQYVLEGGESQNFMNAYDPNLDYNKLKIEESDISSQKAVLGDYLVTKGHETEFIKEMLEDFEDTGKLHVKAEAARKALGKFQIEQREQLLQKQKETQETRGKELKEFWNGVADTIEGSREFAGLRVTEKDKNKFFTYLSHPITKEGYTQRDVDHQKADLDVKLAIDYLMYKGFNLDQIINTKARSKNARSLKDRIIKNEESVKSARKSKRQATKFDIDDLDLNI